jgi:hypothetical protein
MTSEDLAKKIIVENTLKNIVEFLPNGVRITPFQMKELIVFIGELVDDDQRLLYFNEYIAEKIEKIIEGNVKISK